MVFSNTTEKLLMVFSNTTAVEAHVNTTAVDGVLQHHPHNQQQRVGC